MAEKSNSKVASEDLSSGGAEDLRECLRELPPLMVKTH